MKKIAPIALIAMMAVAFTSCKKDYKCSCKDSSGNEIKTQSFKAKKSDAKASCTAIETASSGMFKCSID